MIDEEKNESPPKSEETDENSERNNLATDFNGVTLNATECTVSNPALTSYRIFAISKSLLSHQSNFVY